MNRVGGLEKVPAPHRNEVRVECEVRGKNVTVFECRPPWQPALGVEWRRQPVAQLRHNTDEHDWRLYCADRNGRWHYYDMAVPTRRIDVLLREIDEDPTGIFWG